MGWFGKNEKFNRFTDVEMTLDGLDDVFRIKYVECIREKNLIRFEKKEKIIDKTKVERILTELFQGD